MTQQQQVDATQTPSEAEIAEYLTQHPDFFERHTSLLIRMRLPHAPSGTTISLVERQIALLRQQNDKLQRNLRDLVAVARQNDLIVEKIHRLAIGFLQESSRRARIEQLETSLREDFGAHRAVIVLFDEVAEVAVRGFVRFAGRDDQALAPFSSFLKAAKTRCGLLRDRQKQYLFGAEGTSLASAAMVPLGERGERGFLVIGNRDKDHFNPSGRTDFLERLGDLVTTAIAGGRSSSD
ncbi:MAG TPA: DUF484 family protein [Gammaproteobacteria bacterium]|nr:DUF484 family protein [Gammaproteobacteria bacterium]